MPADDGIRGEAGSLETHPATNAQAQTRSVIAEAAGSASLALAIIGAGILAERLFIQNAGLAVLITACSGAAAFTVLALALRSVAPALFNPAIALALALSGRLSIQAALTYAAGQCAGAMLGVMIAHVILNTGMVQVATQVQSGTGVWLGVFSGTAFFVFLMLAVAHKRGAYIPLVGGVSLLAIALATPSMSFANPALTFARSLTNSFAAIRLEDAAIIVLLQGLASLTAWIFSSWLLPPRR